MSTLHRIRRVLFVAGALGWLLCPAAKPQACAASAKKLKIYISVDMDLAP